MCSTDLSGEIHGIGFEEDDQPSQDRIFNLGGTQNYGITGFQYTSRGATQHFDIPVGQFYTNPGNMRLVVVNDNDAGTGNSGFFSNIRISNNGCLLYTSPSPRDKRQSRMPSSA